MNFVCKHCGHSFNISKKKRTGKRIINKSLSIAVCPECGGKNFYSILYKHGLESDLEGVFY